METYISKDVDAFPKKNLLTTKDLNRDSFINSEVLMLHKNLFYSENHAWLK